jgi:hypothetical protein
MKSKCCGIEQYLDIFFSFQNLVIVDKVDAKAIIIPLV